MQRLLRGCQRGKGALPTSAVKKSRLAQRQGQPALTEAVKKRLNKSSFMDAFHLQRSIQLQIYWLKNLFIPKKRVQSWGVEEGDDIWDFQTQPGIRRCQ